MKTFLNTMKVSLDLMKSRFIKVTSGMVIIKVLSLALLQFVTTQIFNLMLLDANIQGLTNDNFLQVVMHPLALVLLLILLLVITLMMLGEMFLLILYFNHPFDTKPLSLKFVWEKLKRLIKPSIIFLILYVLLVLPNMNLGISASYAAQLRVPRFIIDTLYEQRWMTVLYIIVLVALFILNLFLMYAPIIYVLEEKSFKEACIQSYEMTSKNIKDSLLLVSGMALTTEILSILLSVVILVLSVVLNLFLPVSYHTVNSILITTLFFLILFIVAFSQIFVYQVLVVSYQTAYQNKAIVEKPKKQSIKLRYGLIALTSIFALVLTLVYSVDASDPLPNDTLVVAHRGDTKRGIENTLEALKYAAEYGVDFVEMDIQLTKDDELVVYHDYTLRRLAKRSERVNELTLHEIQDLSITKGSMISTIPSFREYMSLAKSLDQKILVELKADGSDPDLLTRKALEIVQELEMEDMVYYQSLDKKLILNLKEQHPEVIAGYIIGFNIGRLEKLDVDFYSLEASAVSSTAVRSLNRWNKGLFVWTVNDTYGLQTYLDMRVQGVITDIPKQAIYEKENSPSLSLMDKIWRLLP